MNLPSLNRRRLLLGLAAASTAATVAAVPALASVNAAPSENPELVRLGDKLDGAAAQCREADAAYWEIVGVWGPRVPLAPEAITYQAASWDHDSAHWERTIHGIPMLPDRTMYDYDGGGPRPRSVETAEHYARIVKSLRGDIARKRPKHPLSALDVAKLELEIGLHSDKLALAIAYEAERDRVQSASGISGAKARCDAAYAALAALVEQIITADETTMAGVVIKAQAIAAWNAIPLGRRFLPSLEGGWEAKLAASILRIAEGGAAA